MFFDVCQTIFFTVLYSQFLCDHAAYNKKVLYCDYMKNTLITGALVIVVLVAAFFMIKPKQTTTIPVVVPKDTTEQTQPTANPENARIGSPSTLPKQVGKLKADTFTGTLQKVDTGCFSDGECYIEVDGKHITALMGWSQSEVGSVVGVEGFGDLEKYIGKQVEVYAQDNSDGTYTLYGSAGFYIKPI